MPKKAQFYVWGVIAAGVAVLAASLANWSSPQPLALAAYLGLAVLASLLKVRLPGTEGTYSLNFLFLLFGILHFSLAETVMAACVAAAVQSACNARNRPSLIQILFNISNLTTTVGICFLAARLALSSGLGKYLPAEVALIACVYFLINTVLVSGVLSLLQGKHLADVWREWYVWSFPYYLIGAVMVGLIPSREQPVHAEAWLILLPLVYLLHFFLTILGLAPSGKGSVASTESSLPTEAKLYLLSVLTAGSVLLITAIIQLHSEQPLRFACYLALAAATATLKVRLPGMRGTVAASFVVVLVAIVELSFAEAVFLSMLVGVVQCVWKPQRRPAMVQVLFNAACLSLSTAVTFIVCQRIVQAWPAGSLISLLVVATLVHYACNTLMVSAVICLVEHRPLYTLWQNCHFWSCPYYLVGAADAGLMTTTSRAAGWQASLMVLPVMVLIYISYRIHVSRAESAVTSPPASSLASTSGS